LLWFAGINLEFGLEDHYHLHDDLLANAAYHARDAQAQCVDIAGVIFPVGFLAPSDALLSLVSTKLFNIISGIQRMVLNTNEADPDGVLATWKLLAKSGFLREPQLLDFILARCAEDRLNTCLSDNGKISKTEQLPARLLNNANPNIAEAAQIILATRGMRQHSNALLHHELAPELLHQTVWRVVAALQILNGRRDPDVIASAKSHILSHDEGQIGRVAAHKIIHFLGQGDDARLRDAKSAGLDLYVAALAKDCGLDHDHVLRLMDAHSAAPYAVLLRVRDTAYNDALDALHLFKGNAVKPADIAIFEQCYDSIDRASARSEIENWAVSRSAFMASPDMAMETHP
jgi:hypothetical protein